MSTKAYLVPKQDVTWDEIEEVLARLGATAEELEEAPEEGLLQSWKVGDARVHLFEDPGLLVEHLVVEGGDRDRTAEELRQRIPTYAPADMPGLFAETGTDDEDELAQKLGILGAVAPPTADPRLLELFRQGFDHEDPIVRGRAALAATVPAWPELRPAIERLAEEDDDPLVREVASLALENYGKARR